MMSRERGITRLSSPACCSGVEYFYPKTYAGEGSGVQYHTDNDF